MLQGVSARKKKLLFPSKAETREVIPPHEKKLFTSSPRSQAISINSHKPNYLAQIDATIEKAKISEEILGTPNKFQAAVCCHTLLMLCVFGNTSLYRDLFRTLYKAVFATQINPEDIIERFKVEDQESTLECFTKTKTHFDKCAEKRNAIITLKEEIEAWDRFQESLKRELQKKQKLIQNTTHRWQKQLVSSIFKQWRMFAVARRQQRNLFDACLTKLSNRRALEVLRAWQNVAQNQRRERNVERLSILSAKYNTINDRKKKFEEQVAKTNAHISALNTEITQKTFALQNITLNIDENSEHLQHLLEKRSKIKEQCLECLAYCRDMIHAELTFLSEKLEGVSIMNNLNLELLGDEETETILDVPVERLLLKWVSIHVKEIQVANFSSDFRKGALLSKLLQNIHPDNEFRSKLCLVEVKDKEERTHILCDAIESATPLKITSKDIEAGDPYKGFILLSYLFANYPNMKDSTGAWMVTLENIAAFKGTLDQKLNDISTSILFADLCRDFLKVSAETLNSIRREVRWNIRTRDKNLELWKKLKRKVEYNSWQLMVTFKRGEMVSIPDFRRQSELEEFSNLEGFSTSKRHEEDIVMILRAKYEVLKDLYEFSAVYSINLRSKEALDHVHFHGLICLFKDLELTSTTRTIDFLKLVDPKSDPLICPPEFSRSKFSLCLLLIANEMYSNLSPATNLKSLISEYLEPFLQVKHESKIIRMRDKIWKEGSILFQDNIEMLILFYHKLQLDGFDSYFQCEDFGNIVGQLGVNMDQVSVHEFLEICFVMAIRNDPNPCISTEAKIRRLIEQADTYLK